MLVSWGLHIRSNSLNTAGVDSPVWERANVQWRVPLDITGVRISPRPVPIAVPPSRRNGTSEPIWAARSCRSSRVGGPEAQGLLRHQHRSASAYSHPPAPGSPIQVPQQLQADVLAQAEGLREATG